jgi:hypothetical protein
MLVGFCLLTAFACHRRSASVAPNMADAPVLGEHQDESREIDALAHAALELARESSGVRGLASICAKKKQPPTSVIVYRDQGRKLYLGTVAGQSYWDIDGPSRMRVDIRPPPFEDALDLRGIRAETDDLIVEIVRQSPTRADAKISTVYLCGEYGLRLDGTGVSWSARWLDQAAYLPPERWECRSDADCPSPASCLWSWSRWDRGKNAWVGRAGVCLDAERRCDRDKTCPPGQTCASPKEPIVSELTGIADQSRRCISTAHRTP